MARNNKTVISSRVQSLILTSSGSKPTIPNPVTLTPNDPGFKDTDIVVGEFAYNSADGIWFYREENTIQQFLSHVSLTQAEYDALGTYDPNTMYIITDAPKISNTANFIEVTDLEYSPIRTDSGPYSIINRNNANANTTTINNNIFFANDIINIRQKGTGQSEIIAGAGVTFKGDKDSNDDYKISGQDRIVTLICISPSEFLIFGSLIAVSTGLTINSSNVVTTPLNKFSATDLDAFITQIVDKLAANSQIISHTSGGVVTLNNSDRVINEYTINLNSNITGFNIVNISSGGKIKVVLVPTSNVTVEINIGTLSTNYASSTLNLISGEVTVLNAVYDGVNLFWY